MSSIRILVTGGTFDKEYDELSGSLYFQDTHVPEMLRLGRSGLEVEVRTLMMVDSLEMSDADRTSILEHCRSSPRERILITHGTDRMEVTARLLGPGSRTRPSSSPGRWCPTSSAPRTGSSTSARPWPSSRCCRRASTSS